MPEMRNLSQCAVGIVHHFQSEAELAQLLLGDLLEQFKAHITLVSSSIHGPRES